MGYGEDTYDMDSVTIGEIDLAVLGRAFRVICLYLDRPQESAADGEEEDRGDDSTLRARFIDYLTGDGPHELERNIAFRMVFEEMIATSRMIKKVDAILGRQLGIYDEKQENEFEKYAPAG